MKMYRNEKNQKVMVTERYQRTYLVESRLVCIVYIQSLEDTDNAMDRIDIIKYDLYGNNEGEKISIYRYEDNEFFEKLLAEY